MNTLHAPHGAKNFVLIWLLAQLSRKRLEWVTRPELDPWTKK